MGKASVAFGGIALTFFVGAASVNAAPEGSPWYLTALWIGFAVFGILFVFTGLTCGVLWFKRYLNPLDILDDWRCTYSQKDQRLQVTLWIDDRSNSRDFMAECVAQFGQNSVKIDGDVRIGGTYASKSGINSRRDQPMMVEFFKRNAQLSDIDTATILTRIKPLSGVWATKEKIKVVPVQIMN